MLTAPYCRAASESGCICAQLNQAAGCVCQRTLFVLVSEQMRYLVGLAILVAVIGYLFFGWFRESTYTGYFYPDVDNLDYSLKQSGLKDLAACQDWAKNQSLRDSDGLYDYQCGKNCQPSQTPGGLDTCETIEK